MNVESPLPAVAAVVRHAHPVVFIRHGETDWNVVKRLQGRTDIPLNERGRGQARRNGAAVRDHFAASNIAVEDFAFFASPLGRARETMEIVAAELGVDGARIGFDARLVEISFGDWEGNSMKDIEASRPHEVAPRKAAPFTHAPPNGESYAMLTERVAAFLAGVDGPAVIVSHGGVSRAVRGLLAGLPGEEIVHLPVPQDSFFFWENGEGRWL
ncbi:histidine phosphatase family protein [Methylobrevis pamukkalensis]|uniref:Alpha-ribazole phosphatase n=1 Tax=Methylobrevis pamukkalensis TaxID=1439726 RepID=A0A1E3H468_9HYPH|nr:histidine phosphatase family protein [Methylobrevis pamukkalensis]ODN70955.1 Alpha-ribazole phosphatase [Methylobrevis pamukkalensis]